MPDYQDEFLWIRQTFFPRWDRKRKWRFEVVDDCHGLRGRVFDEEKVIRLLPEPDELVRLELMIHEIAHAAGNPYHAQRWQSRMLRAARRAEALGMIGLAQRVREDIENSTRGPFFGTAADAYEMIDNAVMDCPTASFDDIVFWAAREVGRSPTEFLARFPRSRRVYEKAKRFMESEMKLRDQFLKS